MKERKSTGPEVKVLTIANPGAHAIFHRGKNVENRKSPFNFRGIVAIYASKTRRSFDGFPGPKIDPDECVYGQIIGFVEIADCITEKDVTSKTKKWFTGPYGLVLRNPILLKKPIPVSGPKGAVITWNLKGKVLEKYLNVIPKEALEGVRTVEKDERAPMVKGSSRAKLLPTPQLKAVIGGGPFTVKKGSLLLQDYILEKNLFDGRTGMISCDPKLEKLFKKKRVHARLIKDIVSENLNW